MKTFVQDFRQEFPVLKSHSCKILYLLHLFELFNEQGIFFALKSLEK